MSWEQKIQYDDGIVCSCWKLGKMFLRDDGMIEISIYGYMDETKMKEGKKVREESFTISSSEGELLSSVIAFGENNAQGLLKAKFEGN